MNYIDEAKQNFKALSNNPYPGRGIVLGTSADGKSYVQVYWIMGRSVNSRNRVFELEAKTGFMKTKAFDESSLGFHLENAVAAVDATAHDPVDLHVGLAVGAFAKDNATARIGVIGEGLEILFCFVCVFHGPKYRKITF